MIPGALLLAAAAGLTACYLVAEQRLHARGDRWPVRRTAAATGCAAALAAAGLWPARSATDEVAVHLLVTMAAPLLLALSAPVGLTLRVLPPGPRRALVGALHHPWSRAVTWWPVATVLEAAGPWLFYLAPVPHALHPALMVHMVLAGWLFATVVAGPDPVRGRPGVRTCLLALLVVFAVHGTVAKLWFAAGAGAAAQVLAYGGDVVEVATAVAVCARWYRRVTPRPSRAPRTLPGRAPG
ncbi:cytochrome c oxidase assembly protein [Kineococcus rhizosphaerae]|uniref:Putative membrane protein n=1 Tax=Kineococcus rhizosphaerae TaxID=559628 RepID=A0A2T0R9J3_9ACTN|nr:cytochrome c oxidase assembly protein [Kineococcus rhizosphaerae]PRY17836.1 putative membrane protein [Kineococcus rhizosphaerae]